MHTQSRNPQHERDHRISLMPIRQHSSRNNGRWERSETDIRRGTIRGVLLLAAVAGSVWFWSVIL